jgi:hypothetical protein
MKRINIIISIIIIIIFMLILFSNIKDIDQFVVQESFINDIAASGFEGWGKSNTNTNSPKASSDIGSGSNPIDSSNSEFDTQNYEQINNNKLAGLKVDLNRTLAQNSGEINMDENEEKKLGEQEGIMKGHEAEFTECKTKMNEISKAIDGEIRTEHKDIIKVIESQNKIFTQDLKKIHESMHNIKNNMAKNDSTRDILINRVGSHVYNSAQTNQANYVNYVTRINKYVEELQGKTLNAMNKTLIDSINKIMFELMEETRKVKDHCLKKPFQICDSIPECTLNSYGYELFSCGINTDYVI